jgi:hypothetical protein
MGSGDGAMGLVLGVPETLEATGLERKEVGPTNGWLRG